MRTDEDRIKEATPSIRKLVQSILLFLKKELRRIFMLKEDPTLPKRRKRRPRG
jgi:hypothetical protein